MAGWRQPAPSARKCISASAASPAKPRVRRAWTTRTCSRWPGRRPSAPVPWPTHGARCCVVCCCGDCSLRPRLLRGVGWLLRIYQRSGLQTLSRVLRLPALLPANLGNLESQTPTACDWFSDDLIQPVEQPEQGERYTVGLLTGCVQDIVLSNVNRDTADVLLASGCKVITPSVQPCCGSLHAHNGDLSTASDLAQAIDRRLRPGVGGRDHQQRGRLRVAPEDLRATSWRTILSTLTAPANGPRKINDISEWLVEIGWRRPRPTDGEVGCKATYHDALPSLSRPENYPAATERVFCAESRDWN